MRQKSTNWMASARIDLFNLAELFEASDRRGKLGTIVYSSGNGRRGLLTQIGDSTAHVSVRVWAAFAVLCAIESS